jgi:hypothetical protein
MDHSDLSFDCAPLHHLYPDLPCTALADVLARARANKPPEARPRGHDSRGDISTAPGGLWEGSDTRSHRSARTGPT